MEIENYLRLVLMFAENKATTFYKNLERLVVLVLYDYYGEGLTVYEIVNQIKEKYELEFSEQEILKVIQKQKKNNIICKPELSLGEKKYDINPSEYEKIRDTSNNDNISDFITLFLKENTEINFDHEKLEDIFKKFFYFVFNSNKTMILQLMNKEYSKIQIGSTLGDFTSEERECINSFLEWENESKDQFVYSTISCCFDYCMLTIKKDNKVYQNVFSNKAFYLDANIIFRLMGLNNEHRQNVIKSFVAKCKEASITLKYTNFTMNEVSDTIDHYVDAIEKLLGKQSPISTEAMKSMTNKNFNIDFYDQYVKWTKKPINKIGDYLSFKRDLNKRVHSVLFQFKNCSFESFEKKDPSRFTEYYESLKKYKEEKSRNAYTKSVGIDIENYLYVLNENNGLKESSIYGINNYIITADHSFVEWSKECILEAIPIVVLPSVWYSILLKYFSRTHNDFASFSKFLSFSIGENDIDKRKGEILSYVLALDEPASIKEEVIFDIESKLKEKYCEEETAQEIVEESHVNVLNTYVAKAVEEVTNESTQIHNTEKKQWEEQLEKQKEESYRQGEKQAQEEVERKKRLKLEELTDRVYKKRYPMYWGLSILLVIGFIFIVGLLIYLNLTNDNFLKQFQKVGSLVVLLINITYGVVTFVVIKFLFKGLNKEKVRAAIKEKQKQKIDKYIP